MIDRSIFALPGVRGTLAVLVGLALLRAFAVAGQAWALASAIVSLWEGAALLDQSGWIVTFFVCFVARQVLVYVQETYLDRYATARADELRQSLLARIFSGGAGVVQAHGTGSVSALVLEGVDQVETYIRLILPKAVGVVVVPLVLLVWIAPLDWVSGVIAFVAFPFIILYMVILGHTAQDEAAKQHATFQMLSNTFIDALRGIDTLKLFGRGRAYGSSIHAASERFREATMKTLRVAQLSSAVLDLFATGSLAAVAIMLGFRLVDGTLAFFPALVVLVMVPEYFKPVREFASDYHASLDGKNALVAIRAIVQEGSPEPVAEATAGGAEADGSEPAGASDVAIPAFEPHHSFVAAGVGFAYPDYTALHDLSFEVRGCVRVGIVGASGAGKTTLVNLLGGFAQPSAGSFVVGGAPVCSLQRPDWQRQVAYIPQTPYLFHATLRENIAFYRPDAPDADIERAVDMMGLGELVAELADGLDTVVGEGARALSGGQAQRIALARAFLDEGRRVLLFDEPTAHLDIETELELKERMVPLMENRLVFFATHRLHWMANMDVVIVMEGGRVVQVGNPADLARDEGPYRRAHLLVDGDAL